MSYFTNSLFHYTNDITVQESVLTHGLYPNYCKEEYQSESSLITIGIPMVSFCDIPLKETTRFRERYGNFAIGLKKDWGLANGVNPILYVDNRNIFNSVALMLGYRKSLEDENRQNGGTEDQISVKLRPGHLTEMTTFIQMHQMQYASQYLFGFLKPYFIERNGKRQSNYEENEWRYIVPDSKKTSWKWSLKDYSDWRGDKGTPKPAPTDEMKSRGLTFTVADINWIVTPDNDTTVQLIDFITASTVLCGIPLSDNDKLLLISKVTQFDAIENDM